jgi:hypothetical protein
VEGAGDDDDEDIVMMVAADKHSDFKCPYTAQDIDIPMKKYVSILCAVVFLMYTNSCPIVSFAVSCQIPLVPHVPTLSLNAA